MPNLGIRLLFTRISFDAVNTGQNADHVAVENRRGLIEGDAANRASSVAADPGEGENRVEGLWEFTIVFCDDLLSGFLHVADACVVTEAFPEFMNLVGMSFGQGFDGWQFAHPAVIIRDDGFDLRLLKHDFRDPNRVGIAGAPPRKIAGVGGKPREEGRSKL